MTSRARAVSILPLLAAACLYAWVTRSPLVLSIVTGGALVALLVGRHIDAPAYVQRAVVLLVGLVSVLSTAPALSALEPWVETRPSALPSRLAVTALLLVTTRRFFRDPEGGMRPDFGLLTLTVLISGQRHVGLGYVVGVVGFLAAIVTVVRARDPGMGWSVVERHAVRSTLAALATATMVSALGIVAIPKIARLTQRQLQLYVLPKGRSQVGYTERLGTASPDPLVESDTVVLRLYGPHVDYLRGAVYQTYEGGTWSNASDPLTVVSTGVAVPYGPSIVEIRGVGALQHPDHRLRYFVPLGARSLGTAHENVLVDAFGVLRPDPDDPPTPLSFSVGPSEHPPLAASDADLDVHPGLRVTLEAIALAWTEGAASPREKVVALEAHLTREFTYTLDGIPISREPAVVNFLLRTKRGRCELFATALALLARTVGVPTRMVGGFRVSEHNALGGYDVVREKNAHAWVEAWVAPGVGGAPSWQTFDATPATEANMRRERSDLSAFGDAVLAAWDRALELLARASLWQFGVLLGVAVALLTLVRLLRARRQRLAARADEKETAPLPFFAELEAALAAAGHARAPSEPLEAFAERLRASHQEEAARVVLAYGALRYGNVGNVAEVAERAIASTHAALSRAPRR